MVGKRCLKEKYGNCGPLLEGETHCLFHKPDKNKAENEKFYEQLKKQATVESVKAIGLDGGSSKRDRLTFTNKVAWRGYRFPADEEMNYFRDATFESEADFVGATFEGVANFADATFGGEANFFGAKFEGVANFVDATFGGDEGVAFFALATFGDAADFRDATFGGEGSFFGAKFGGVAGFTDAIFESRADFVDAIFGGAVNFFGAKFGGVACFADAIFGGVACFADAIFEREVDFRDATFESRASFIDGTCFRTANFSNVVFDRTCTFSGRTFGNFLYFNNCNFHQGVVIEDDWQNPESNKYIFPQAEQEGCRAQKITYEKEGRKEAAEVMFLREMRARREDRVSQYEEADGKTTRRKKPLWEKEKPLLYRFCWGNLIKRISTRAEYLLVDLTSNYGTSWLKVIVTALTVILIFTACYFSAAHLSSVDPRIGGIYSAQPTLVELSVHNETAPTLKVKTRDKLQDAPAEFVELLVNIESVATVEVNAREKVPVKNFLKLLYFSAATFSTTGYGNMHPVGLMKLFTTLQSFFGVFFGALFVVVFARKWMR